jgi:hypothetical protein
MEVEVVAVVVEAPVVSMAAAVAAAVMLQRS